MFDLFLLKQSYNYPPEYTANLISVFTAFKKILFLNRLGKSINVVLFCGTHWRGRLEQATCLALFF